MAAQGDARGMLAQAPAVGWRRVKVVHTVLDGIVHLFVDHLLVNLGIIISPEGLAVGRGQAHHAITQDGNLLFGLGVLAIGHFAHGRFLGGNLLAIT